MAPNKVLTQARRYADGDGVLIDLERAKDLYATIAGSLEGEDLILYRELCALYPTHNQATPGAQGTKSFTSVYQMNQVYPMRGVSIVKMSTAATSPTSSVSITPTPDQIRLLLENLLSAADDSTLSRIYSALIKISDPHSVRKEENIIFGNNLKVLLFQCGKKASDLRLQLANRGMKKISAAALSRKIGGWDGTSEETLAQMLTVFNEAWIPKYVQFRDSRKSQITSSDMKLPPDEFFKLFKSPKIDDSLRTFLLNIGVIITE